MSSRTLRTFVILALAVGALGSELAITAQAPHVRAPAFGDVGSQAPAAVVFSQPPNLDGGLLKSSKRDPDGSATDEWVWDGFMFGWTQALTEVQWRGGYDPAWLGSGGPVFDFTVAIYASIPSGSQPDLSQPPLVQYEVGGNAHETPAEVLGGVQTYDYSYVLPAPFQAAAGTKYWLQIEAFQSGPPDWGLAKAQYGDGLYFRRIVGPAYQLLAGDAAFALVGPLTATATATQTATATATQTATATATTTPTRPASPHAVFLPLMLR